MKNILIYMVVTITSYNVKKARTINYNKSVLNLFCGTAWFILLGFISNSATGQAAASYSYTAQTGTLGTTYSWIDCSSGTNIVTGDDARASIAWPFNFSFYDNTYTTTDYISVSTNGFIRFDGDASTTYSTASNYTLSSTSTELGQIIAMDVYDCNVSSSSWVRSLVTGSSPNRIFTIEFNNHEIDYNDGNYANVQVSFYESTNKIVLKLGTDNITKSGVDMGIHSGVNNYYNKWQEVQSGTNNTWVEYTPDGTPPTPIIPAASWNYDIQTGVTGTTYSWIDCSLGTTVVSGDDAHAEINWPFDFHFYDNNYSTDRKLSVSTNGFIRLDGIANNDYTVANAYDLTSTATNLGQIIALALYDGNVGSSSWVKSLVTGSAPNRIFTIEFNTYEIDYNDGNYANVQVSFYESSNKIVLKLGTDNITKSGVDLGIHSGVDNYYNKWQEVQSGTNNTWIEYTPPYLEVNSTEGISTAHYFTLKDAFDKINNGTHQGVITIKVRHSTTEAASAVLYGSGTGSANYSSVNIYPTKTGLSISGNIAAPLIDLNGADNVTIDGRLNATGTTKDLSIINTSTASVEGTSAIRFINEASDNIVKYCTIKSSETRATSGIIFFSTSTGDLGNNNNTISNNNITNASDANRPVNAIFSSGTTGKDNSGNTISNNNIYDFLKHATASNGIFLSSNTSEWTIDGNSFYESTSFSPTGTVTYDVIEINNVFGNGFIVTNNYIGGSDVQCGGTAWTKSNSTTNLFRAIYLEVGTTTVTSVQNNTIQNFNWSNFGIANWIGIKVVEGDIDIGTTTGNTIGATTGTGSISVTGGTNGQTIYGFRINGTGEINCKNNTIGSLTGYTSSTYSTHIYGIELSGSATVSIANNTIGSATTASSIYASSASTANVQKIYGIYSSSSGTTEIHENTISNLKNNTSNTAVGTAGLINGIYVSAGTNTVCHNTVNDISIANANTSTNTPSAVGIFLDTETKVQTIENNTIYNVSNTYSSFTGSVVGLYSKNLVETNTGGVVNANFIHSLSVSSSSTGAKIYGIYENTDSVTYSNNVISLGGTTSTSIFGFYDVGDSGKIVNIYFNSIYISGTNSGSEESYAIKYNTNINNRDLRNNIFFNARSGGTGSQYAVYYNATGGTFTADYNDYYISGTGGVIGYSGGDITTLALLQTATSQDANSLNTDPIFTLAGGTNSSDYAASASLPGVAGTGITLDYENITRNNPPKMGAMEVSAEFVWTGTSSTDFATTTNWENGIVPPDGANISFATTPANDCYLDQNRTIKNITNTSTKKLAVNGKQLTLKGNIVSSTADQIDASSTSSVVVFKSIYDAQSIPSGVFVNNTIDALTLDNSHGLTQNGDLIVSSTLTLTAGAHGIGANTLTINGAISTTSGSLTGGSTSNIVIGGSGTSTILPGVELNNLTLNRANGITLGGDVTVAGTLALTNGTLTLDTATITISGSSPTLVSGNIDASNSAATLEFTNSSVITCPESIFTGSINNLTINGAGISTYFNYTINGTLNLQSANQSSTIGTLDMGSDTLTMGANATTVGIGDVTGIVRRAHTFASDTLYSFGSKYTTFTFIDANTKPTWICVKIGIGTVPGWDPWTPTPNGKVKRLYQVSCSDNSSTSQTDINMRYLLSELDATYNDETKLLFWHKETDYNNGIPHEHGKSNQDITQHFIGVTGLVFGTSATTNLDDSQIAIAYSVNTKNTWKGEVTGHETEWEQAQNWSAGTVPVSTDDVLIPGGLTYYPSLTSLSNAVAKSIEIEIGASITANSYNLTVSGAEGAWINLGTFYPGTGTVIFDHGVSSEIVTIAGTTNLYNISVGANTSIAPVQGCILRIAGAASATTTSKADWSAINSTVEWNGVNQNILNPTGLDGNSGYYNLILSGSGTKTMPATALNIVGDFSLDGSVTATAASEITIGGDLNIGNGTTFATGTFDHVIGGDFENNGTFTVSSGNTITFNGTTTQSILGSTSTNFEELTINNGAGVDIYTNVTVNDTLFLTDGNLNVGATTLTINSAISKTSGFINTNTFSSLTFGGTTALVTSTNLFATTPIINNLTINRTGGVELGCNFTVNGVLYLQSANPSSTKGCLDMGTYTLSMGDTATTAGEGDLTGIVKREHTFLMDTQYSFGSQYTTITFIDDNLKPTWISIKISIGSEASWSPWTPLPNGKVKRLYKLACSDNSSTAITSINMRYLLSELDATYNDESMLVFWHKKTDYASGAPHEHGKAVQDFTNHYIGVSGLTLGSAVTTAFDDSQVTMAYSIATKNTWKGEVIGHETEWEQTQNWTAGNVPLSTEDVLIPGGLSYYPSLTALANAVAKTIEIESGASITANSYNITVSGANGAWINNGTFTPGTGTVIFNHGVSSEIATVAGVTNFYNISIGTNTTIVPVPGCTFRIAGAATGTSTSKANWSVVNSTVEWNGVNQNINNPQGTGGNSGYYNLILSGSGTKTMPSSVLTVHGDFTMSGTASATAADSIIVLGNTTIGSGSAFATGSYTHLLYGDFENNGTFTGTSGGTVIFMGSSTQTISGTSTTTFDGLRIDNTLGVTQEASININNELSFYNGVLNVGSNTLGINGTILNPSGNIGVNSSSSLSFGGTDAITLNNNLFNGNPTINNLTINRSGGVTLGNESITVNGTLALTNGTFTIAANTLTLAGNSPTRVSGNIDASNTSATLKFTNSSAITLPSSIFSGSVNNFTINGAGGITSGSDITMNGILNLQSANPSSIKGSLDMSNDTLHMSATATTIGIGDVTGIVKREHTFENGTEYSFGNQYTTINFIDVSGSTKPAWIKCKIVIGSSPTWRSEAIKRYYSFAQSGGDDRMIIKLHYLDNELHDLETDETQLVYWDAYDPAFGVNNFVKFYPRNKNGNNVNSNWIQLTGPAINYIATSDLLDVKQWGLSYTNVTEHTWTGNGSPSYDGDWSLPGNWNGGVPNDSSVVVIPNPNDLPVDNNGDLNPYTNLLPVISPAKAQSIEISTGATLSATDYDITIYGDGNAWVNNGTFTAGTATVTFANGDESETVSISGTTNFYNLILSDKTNLQPATNCITRIEGKLSADISCCILDCAANINTVEYNGGEEQTVINPGGVYGYHHLIFSGTGTKILPESTVRVLGDLTISTTILATGNTLLMAGTSAQSIGGYSATTLNNLNIDNAIGVTLTNTALTTISGSLLINSGKIFKVAAAKKLSVTGSISNNAGNSGFVLNSNATGTASLLHNTDNVATTVERYISGDAEEWHFLSSPVSNQGISGNWLPSGNYGNGTGYDLYVWNEPTNCWIYQRDSSSTVNWQTVHPTANFVTGKGYLYSVEELNPTKEFAGGLSNGTQTIPISYSSLVDSVKGFNLIGNPYPSSIDWMASSGWLRSNLVPSGSGYDMWIWNPEANNYGVFNSGDATGIGTNSVTRYISPMQGFFVRAESAGNLEMNNDIRVHDATTSWKSAHINPNRISAVVYSESDGTFDEVRLMFGYPENRAGAAKLFSPVVTAPSLYLPFENANYTIRYLTDTIINPYIPITFKPGRDGNYSINFDFEFGDYNTIILEDCQTGEHIDLNLTSNYQFTASKTDNPNRFVLHFSKIRENINTKLPANIYSTNESVVIDLTKVDEVTDIKIVDVIGRTILHKKLNGNTINYLPVDISSQILIIYAKTKNATISKKVFVN